MSDLSTPFAEAVSLLVGGLLSLAFTLAAIRSVRTRRFFEIEPSTDKLSVAWSATHYKQVALWGRGVSVVALLSCLLGLTSKVGVWASAPLGVLAVVLSLIGLSRVDAMATSPIGRQGAATCGVRLGAAVMLASAGLFFFQRFGPRLMGSN